MGSYYREHVSYPNVTAGPYPPHVIAAALENVSPANDFANDDGTRRCSVKGCSSPLSPEYTHKMCDECRSRHRVYAMTKRAKRKMEKALLNGSAQNGQSVVWMPQDDAVVESEHEPGQSSEPVAGPSRQYESHSQVPVEDGTAQQFDFPEGWDPDAIDPRLFSHTSELAGALTLPHAPQDTSGPELFARSDQSLQQPPQQGLSTSTSVLPPVPSSPPEPEIHPVLAEVLKAVPNFSLSTRITSGPTVDASVSSTDGPLPPRFCSIKGCKRLIPGSSFFKMCQPCRDRYRTYGTTKRAKWRREKEAAGAELYTIPPAEDSEQHASKDPLPQTTPPGQWNDPSPPISAPATPLNPPPPAAGSSSATIEGGVNASQSLLMCSVSHCREVLPVGYQYRRCERHRVQNRHHSKLKRVRDKEVKAQVNEEWAAAIAGGSPIEDVGDNTTLPDVTLSAQDIARVFGELEKELRERSLGPDFAGVISEAGEADQQFEDTPLGEPSSGLPPAARGMRRTNHVCSMKTCANLLSPSNPWKMCDLCRSRDRTGRRLKALRDSGLISQEVAAGKIIEVKMEVEGREEKGENRETGQKTGEQVDNPPPVEALAGERVASGSGSNPDVLQHHRSPPDAVEDQSASIDPSALHHSPSEVNSHVASVFASVPMPSHTNLVFMEPIIGDITSTLQHFVQMAGESSMANGADLDLGQQAIADADSDHQSASSSSAPVGHSLRPDIPLHANKKRGKGKGKAKNPAQSAEDPATVSTQQGGETAHAANAPAMPPTHSIGVPSVSAEGQPPPPPPYAPPLSGQSPYPYYMPPPYMPPYGPPINYQYGYPLPPPSPSKGPYGPPPMYQAPYGAYPYPYSYPGQPYPFPGQPYAPPPPPGQLFSPPHTYPTAEQPQPPIGQPYPQQYPYAQGYPPPPPLPPPGAQQVPVYTKSTATPSGTAGATSSIGPSPDAAPSQGNLASDKTADQLEPGQKPTTFIVRTSEAYERPPIPTVSKPTSSVKRKRDDEPGELVAAGSKRAEVKASGKLPHFRIPSSSDIPAPDTSSVPTEAVQRPVTNTDTGVQVKVHCSNKNCKRVLPASASGSTICERCVERLKKRQSKAKHRYKLEPKSLLGRSVSGEEGVTDVTA